ncbi:metallophosphoesterase [Candidatus Koribacter versatilis Ellin345]|uniref:Metallophosphoesterase n=1 Tax=Koribacter versatilis (strain Ellin345) TaxID=204669 RepID=Q1ILC2_KORVE|nr:Ig-like domain-containing protein [Candidatus Koribacter versatilis]ABF42328.1 metallophosphoesterase [Candidatus Koribacter versatilis Ellin345]
MKATRCFVLVVCVSLLFSVFTLAHDNGDFTIIAMPDVQNESQYYPQVLHAETQWIVNARGALNIQAVVGLGDIVNNGSDNTQWANADAAFRLLDNAGIPYLLAIGNHDYDNAAPASRSAVGFNEWFGPWRYAGRPWYDGNYNGSNENFYGVLRINRQKYLVLLMEYVPRDAALSWAAQVIAANQDKQVIIVTHSYMYSDNTRVDQCDTQDLNTNNYGDKQWSKLVSQYPNVELVLSGHITNGTAAQRADLGKNGNLVNQVFSNYQTLPNGGNGYLRIMTFHPASNTIDVKTYSPFLNSYMTDARNQFTIPWRAPRTFARSGAVSGLVRDSGTCKRIAGATVAVGPSTAVSDANGFYSLTLPGGTYSASGVASAYDGSSTSVAVSNGYAVDANFFLKPNAPCAVNQASPSVTICAPADGAVVNSPARVTAGTTDNSSTVSFVQLYVDGVLKLTQSGGILDTSVTLTSGAHRLTVQAKDAAGAVFKQSVSVTVP